jgi:anti-sigma factor RsiW
MSCELPPELEDLDLLAYLDGEAALRVTAHLERCAYCRQKAQRLARLQGRLTARLYRLTCPPSQELGEFHLGMLEPDRAGAVGRHLAECPHCRREVTQLKGYLAELSPEVRLSAREQVQVRIAQLVRRVDEAFPPAAPALVPAYAAVRGADEGPRLYEAGGLQVAVETQADAQRPDRRVVLGLIIGAALPGMEAHLWQAEQRVAGVPVDDVGNFVVPGLPPGRYELILSSPQLEIHIQDLAV